MDKIKEFYSYDKIFTYDHLYKSYLKCRKGCNWKASVQRFNSQASYNVYKIYIKLKKRQWKHGDYYEFDRIENGKLRHIQAEYFQDRIVQRCFCDYSLLPILTPKLIYDNSASQKNKGIDFALRRCKKHLQDHINAYGDDGYIISNDKQQLNEILGYLQKWSNDYGIPLNEKKTHITKLSKAFTFLKRKYIITNDNKIVITLDKHNVHKMKRKIKLLKQKFNRTNEYICQLFNSWYLGFMKWNCYTQLSQLKIYTNKIIKGGFKWNKTSKLN